MPLKPEQPKQVALSHLLAIASEAATAGSEVIRHSNRRAVVATKSTATDIVTETDLAAEAAIIKVLTAATPGAHLYGEESGQATFGTGSFDHVEWIVDPLDGTVNFSYGIPFTAVSVAASIDGEVCVGVVIDGTGTQHFSAVRDGGAFLNGTQIAVSGCSTPHAALVATGFAYDGERRREHAERVAALIADVRDVRAFGSAALHLCGVAAGYLDCYAERHIKPWDWAAGSLICTEAGAWFEWPCPENDDLVMASTPAIFDELRVYF